MKVRCIQLINPHTGIQEAKSDWLSIGNVYHVLSVYV